MYISSLVCHNPARAQADTLMNAHFNYKAVFLAHMLHVKQFGPFEGSAVQIAYDAVLGI